MAKRAVAERQISIRQACLAFRISETCYRYEPKLSEENAFIADWLLRLTTSNRNCGFGLCFLYLRNVKGYSFNHMCVRRIYCELELNLRIKPKKRLVREKPEPLQVPESINRVWSMDFMSDVLACRVSQIDTRPEERTGATASALRVTAMRRPRPGAPAYGLARAGFAGSRACR